MDHKQRSWSILWLIHLCESHFDRLYVNFYYFPDENINFSKDNSTTQGSNRRSKSKLNLYDEIMIKWFTFSFVLNRQQ
jgi:hypothetical protein